MGTSRGQMSLLGYHRVPASTALADDDEDEDDDDAEDHDGDVDDLSDED